MKEENELIELLVVITASNKSKYKCKIIIILELSTQ